MQVGQRAGLDCGRQTRPTPFGGPRRARPILEIARGSRIRRVRLARFELGRNTDCRIGINFYFAGAPEQPTLLLVRAAFRGCPTEGRRSPSDDDLCFPQQRLPLRPQTLVAVDRPRHDRRLEWLAGAGQMARVRFGSPVRPEHSFSLRFVNGGLGRVDGGTRCSICS